MEPEYIREFKLLKKINGLAFDVQYGLSEELPRGNARQRAELAASIREARTLGVTTREIKNALRGGRQCARILSIR